MISQFADKGRPRPCIWKGLVWFLYLACARLRKSVRRFTVLAPVDPPFNNLSLLAASAFGLVSKAMREREREREMFLPSLFFPRQTLLFFGWTAGKYSIALSSQFFPSERLLAFGVQIIRRLLLSFFALVSPGMFSRLSGLLLLLLLFKECFALSFLAKPPILLQIFFFTLRCFLLALY